MLNRRNSFLTPRNGFWIAAVVMLLAGCERAPAWQYSSSEQVAALSPELQAQVRSALEKYCGTPSHPKLMGNDNVSTAHLLYGQSVYMKRCAQCHGATGDGQGAAAQWLSPRPRDYRRGKFKFTSTVYDSRPVRADLVRTIKSGVTGTSMPAFNLLPEKDLEAVIDYVLVLSHRGELEFQLATEADASEQLEPETITELAELVMAPWNGAQAGMRHPLTPEPIFTVENVAAGKRAFLSRGCSKCHGEDGRGQTPDNLRGDLKDFWGFATKAADLTSGTLHGGRRPEDVYLRIFNGITGTPMPSFTQVLASEPETYWNLVSYVLYVSNRRRAGEIPEAGLTRAPTAPEADAPVETVGTPVEGE
jgi:mono/diheme cytochrome c family protein